LDGGQFNWPGSGFALKHAGCIDFLALGSVTVAALFDPPIVAGPLVEISGEMFIEIAAVGAECFIFIIVAHGLPPHEKVTLKR
jgi:hypothetical protein